jgi:gluconokinase
MSTNACAFIVMGVAGAGKSTVAAGLAAHFGAVFLEGDDFHPAANVEKMTRGEPLTDADRGPWIDALAAAISVAPARLIFASCSALTPDIRKRLCDGASRPVEFLLLDAPEDVILRRLEQRRHHFMKPHMLRSQFETLKRPDHGIVVDASLPSEGVLAAAISAVEVRLARND